MSKDAVISMPQRAGRVMAERLKNKVLKKKAYIVSRWPRMRVPELPPDASEAAIALGRAWMVTMIATALLLVALAVAPMWNSARYLEGLGEALGSDPQLWQPAGETAADGSRSNVFVSP